MEDVDRTKTLVETRELCERHRLIGEAARDWDSFVGWTELDPEDYARGFRLSSDTKKKDRISSMIEEMNALKATAEEKITEFLYAKEKELRVTLRDLEALIRETVRSRDHALNAKAAADTRTRMAENRAQIAEQRADRREGDAENWVDRIREEVAAVPKHKLSSPGYVEKVTLDKVKKGDWVYNADERDVRVQFRILEAENKRLERENAKLKKDTRLPRNAREREQKRSFGVSGLACSFCYKAKKDVLQMISGAGVYICDECVALCLGICEENGLVLDRGEYESPPPVPKEAVELTATEIAEDLLTRVQGFLEKDPEFAGSLWAAATKHLEKKEKDNGS